MSEQVFNPERIGWLVMGIATGKTFGLAVLGDYRISAGSMN